MHGRVFALSASQGDVWLPTAYVTKGRLLESLTISSRLMSKPEAVER